MVVQYFTTIEFITLLVISITAFIVYLKYKFQYWSKRGVSTVTPILPFGHVKEQMFRRKFLGVILQEFYNAMKPTGARYAGFYTFTKPSLVILEPNLMKTIMTKEFPSFHDRAVLSDEKNEPLTGHLFAVKGEKWRFLRTKLSPTFTSGKMKMMFHSLVTCGQQLDETISVPVEKNEPVDIKELMARFTTDVIGSCAFGLDCNSLKDPDSEFRKYGKMIFQNSVFNLIRRTILILFPKLSHWLKIPLVKPQVRKFFMDTTRQMVEYREKNKIDRKDFMNLLIRLKNNEIINDDEDCLKTIQDNKKYINDKEPGLTMDQVAAQTFVFFVAGFETSSSTMTFCLYELSINEEIQNKTREDILKALKEHNGNITYDAIMEMHYLDKVIKETLRKYPIVPILSRQCVKDFQIPDSNLHIEKGTNVFIPVLGIQRDPEYYPNPIKFDPDRFDPEVSSQRHPYTYLPFGEGPRNCIGMRFGLMQAKVGIAFLLKNYTMSLNKNTSQPLTFDPTGIILSASETILLDMKKINT